MRPTGQPPVRLNLGGTKFELLEPEVVGTRRALANPLVIVAPLLVGRLSCGFARAPPTGAELPCGWPLSLSQLQVHWPYRARRRQVSRGGPSGSARPNSLRWTASLAQWAARRRHLGSLGAPTPRFGRPRRGSLAKQIGAKLAQLCRFLAPNGAENERLQGTPLGALRLAGNSSPLQLAGFYLRR